MKTKINTALLTKLQPKEKRYEVRDTELMGFMVRVQPSGKMTYRCEYERKKSIHVATVGTVTLKQARERARELIAKATMGEDIGRKPKPKEEKLTFEHYLETTYKPWLFTERKAAKDTYAKLTKDFIPFLGGLALTDITPALLIDWRSQALEKEKNQTPEQKRKLSETLNRKTAVLRACLSHAVDINLIDANPLARLKPLKTGKHHVVRYLSEDETKRLLEALNEREAKLRQERESANQWRRERGYKLYPVIATHEFADHLKPLVLLALNTGLRQGALFNLKWEFIDFSNRTFFVPAYLNKNGKAQHFPLNQIAYNVLQQWYQQRKSDSLIFPGKDKDTPLNNVNKAWRGVLANADITNFRWHDMRHDFASKLIFNGVSLYTVSKLLAHSSISVTERYAHLEKNQMSLAAEKLVATYA